MKAAYLVNKTKGRKIDVLDIAVPVPNSLHNCLVKIQYSGICGSDMPKYFGERGITPLVLGHEFCGTLLLGPEKLKGKLVTIKPIVNCGKCDGCLDNRINHCNNQMFYGSNLNGGMQEYIVVNEKQIFGSNKLKSDPVLATLIEPLSNAINATSKIKSYKNKKIGIVGKGVIGRLIYFTLIKKYKVKDSDISFITRTEKQKDNSFEIVFECSGVIDGINSAINSCKYNGKIIQVGIAYPEDFSNKDFNFDRLLRKEQTMIGSWQSNYKKDWDESLKLLKRYKKLFLTLITKEFPIKEINEAFEYKRNEKKIPVNKVVIKMEEE